MTQSHYEVLGLQPPHNLNGSQDLTVKQIKRAYLDALLKYHPDKSKLKDAGLTVDDLKKAYETLSNSDLRQEYDKSLIRQTKEKSFHTGEEVLDLDDLPYDEVNGVWYRSCRCGQDRGYVLTEPELEAEADRGGKEVVVGCQGCSLWIRVGFAVAQDDGDQTSSQQMAKAGA